MPIRFVTASAAPLPQPHHHPATQSHIYHQTFPTKIIDYSQRSDPTPVEQIISNEIHTPVLIGRRHCRAVSLIHLHAHDLYLVEKIIELETELTQELSRNDTSQRLMAIPRVGLITASVLSSQLDDGKQYARSRYFTSSTRLVPKQYSTGGKNILMGSVSEVIKIYGAYWFNAHEYIYNDYPTKQVDWQCG